MNMKAHGQNKDLSIPDVNSSLQGLEDDWKTFAPQAVLPSLVCWLCLSRFFCDDVQSGPDSLLRLRHLRCLLSGHYQPSRSQQRLHANAL